jgi:hypothetical protein
MNKLISPDCEGCSCSCHINPPCTHCVDHVKFEDDLNVEEVQELLDEGWGRGNETLS